MNVGASVLYVFLKLLSYISGLTLRMLTRPYCLGVIPAAVSTLFTSTRPISLCLSGRQHLQERSKVLITDKMYHQHPAVRAPSGITPLSPRFYVLIVNDARPMLYCGPF